MSHLVRPPTPPDDDLDGRLRAFYRAEMPDPWPSWQAPASRVTLPARPTSRRKGFWGSRLALAASVALLLGGSLFLSGAVPALGTKPPIKLHGGDAIHPKDPGEIPGMRQIRELIVDPKEGTTFDKLILTPDDGAPIK
jgi:hypothetical protein